MKPYFSEAGVTIYHGEALRVLPGLDCDRAITDPPYGFRAYATDDARGVTEVLAALLDRARTVATFGYPELLVEWSAVLGRTPGEWITWWPTNRGAARAKTILPRESEAVAVYGELCGPHLLMRPRAPEGVKIRSRIGRRATTGSAEDARLGDVWIDALPAVGFNSHLRNHPTEKPLAIMARLVTLCSHPGETILDPFVGSGTTLLAAKNLGRKAIGIEISEEYCEVAAKRLAQGVLPLEVAR